MASIYEHRINNDPYWFKVDLYNANGKVQTIAPAGIKALVLEDCFYNFYHKGYIIVDNRYDSIERSVTENVQTNAQSPSFILMGDARDWINIEIIPTGENNELLNDKVARHSRIFLQGAIYNVEEIATDTPDVKYKKFYFWDKYYQYLNEKNLYWSTAEVVENRVNSQSEATVIAEAPMFRDSYNALKRLKVKNVGNFSDTQRSIPTGEAIKALLATALPEEDKYPALFPGSNFNKSGEVTTAPDLIQNDPNWDLGSTSIFFSSPARFKAIDGLIYLLHNHVSTPENLYDQAFLRIDRATRCFTLRSLSSYFKNAYDAKNDSGGAFYVETITLGGYGYDNEKEFVFATVSDFTPKKNYFKLSQTGSTVNFALEPSLGLLTQKDFVTRYVHSYDFNDKQFQIDASNNKMEQVMKVYQTNYVDTIKQNRWSSIVPGINRMTNKNIAHIFALYPSDELLKLSQGRNKALYTAIFGNNQVRFKVPGSTLRQAGMFIGVDRKGSSPANEYDQKFLGIYFITEVKHVFENNNYYNELVCVKTYTDLQIYKGQVGPNNQNINSQETV
jgi:hypothetical protein